MFEMKPGRIYKVQFRLVHGIKEQQKYMRVHSIKNNKIQYSFAKNELANSFISNNRFIKLIEKSCKECKYFTVCKKTFDAADETEIIVAHLHNQFKQLECNQTENIQNEIKTIGDELQYLVIIAEGDINDRYDYYKI